MEQIVGIFVIACILACGLAGPVATPVTQFSCRFYSDGTYACRETGRSSDTDDETKQTKGTWQTSDGFFALTDPKGPREFKGQCSFQVSQGMLQGGYSCSGAPRITKHADGTESGVGGGMFFGTDFTGTPGGPIRVGRG